MNRLACGDYVRINENMDRIFDPEDDKKLNMACALLSEVYEKYAK
jgi:hypothetical protein|tara:strand:- start:637 stop:771 length:135 start_codon:yes stop_codon:yes gene_type:complete